MDELVVDLEATRRKARALLDVADEVSRVRLPEAAQAVAAAMPGSDSSRQALALADAWGLELRAWVADATRVAEAIETCLRDFAVTDDRAAQALARMRP